MADQGREALELAIGTMMAQAAFVEFLVKKGVIETDPLLEHFAAKLVSWEKAATPNALFPLQTVAALIAGRKPPAPPSSVH
jgi:hypothetical protein